MQKEVIYVFDLDFTLLPSANFNEDYKKGKYENLDFIPEAIEVVKKFGKSKCILLTFDRYGDQFKKLEHLQVEKYFSKVIIVTDKKDKRTELENIMNDYEQVVVIGDRYDEGELSHAVELGLKTVCVDLPGGMYTAKDHHHKFDLIIQSEKDFSRILEI
jgi:FMN phosphatase YigB (HAD superfamily)